MRSKLWPIANGVMCALFILSAVVQVNDPDPTRWIAIYLTAATISAVEVGRRIRWVAPALVVAVTLVWAATIAPRVVGAVGFSDMFSAWEMKNIGIEEEREMYGLLIIAVWMAAVAVAAWRRRASVLD